MGGAEENSDIQQDPADDKPRQLQIISDERRNFIQQSLDAWCENQGYKDCNVNMLILSHTLCISKNELSLFFDQCLHSNFRIWLSEIRFNAAKKMMLEYPDYSNDIISAECGFFLPHPSLPHLQEQGRVLAYRMEKICQKGVAFLGMLLLFGRNATLFQGNATPFFSEKH